MSQIETQRLILRPFVIADAEAVSRNSKQSTVAHFLPDMVLQTAEDARAWICRIETKCNIPEHFMVFAIERKADNSLMGFVGVAPKEEIENEIEICFAIADEYQNNGYATEAGKAMVWWAFEKAGQDVLSAIIKPENKASRRVIEKIGFIHGDRRNLPYCGNNCEFDYFRLYHTDYLPGPDWDERTVYRPEPMSAFFNVRAEGYNKHILSGDGTEDYEKLGSYIPKTQDSLRILDVGCGTGIELDYIWSQAPNSHIVCLDMSRGMLDLLLKNHSVNYNRITTIEASYLDWDYPANAFDLVVSNTTMHHLWPGEKEVVYQKILSCLKEGGCYIEGDFIVDALLAEQYRRRYASITASLASEPKAGEYHIDIPCTVETQTQLLTEAGFRSVEVLDEYSNKPRGGRAILMARK